MDSLELAGKLYYDMLWEDYQNELYREYDQEDSEGYDQDNDKTFNELSRRENNIEEE